MRSGTTYGHTHNWQAGANEPGGTPLNTVIILLYASPNFSFWLNAYAQFQIHTPVAYDVESEEARQQRLSSDRTSVSSSEAAS